MAIEARANVRRVAGFLVVVGVACGPGTAVADAVDFSRDIQPVLAKRCFA